MLIWYIQKKGVTMFTILSFFQLLGLAIILVQIAYLLKVKPTKLSSTLLAFDLCVFVNTLGYMLEMTSVHMNTALMATRVAYFGKVYLAFLMLLFLLRYYGYTINKIITGVLFIYHTFIAMLVLTSSSNNLYYTDMIWHENGLFHHVDHGHGPFYYINTSFSALYLLLFIIICITQYKKASSKQEKRMAIILLIAFSLPSISMVLYFTNWIVGYDPTNASYIIAVSILFIYFVKNKFFDTLELAKDFALDSIDNGIVVLDNYNSMLYANNTAKEIIPELKHGSNKAAIDFLYGLVYSKENYLKDKSVYNARVQAIYSDNIILGKMILMEDITTTYNYARNLEKEVANQTAQLEYIQTNVITSMAGMIEARDGITGHHVKRTSAYVKIVATELRREGKYPDELTEETVKNIIQAAPLHDIGKVAIPDAILCKPGKLTDEEFDVIKTHPSIGASMIEEILKEVEHDDYLKVARDVANYHHEKWNGTGYPCGLAGNDIPLPARIMAITDVFEALISERPYKKSFSYEKAIEIIKEGSGQHFDPIIVTAFLNVLDEIKSVG